MDADLKQRIQPLLGWLHNNSASLKAQGRWPLQQEDIPENLLPQWTLYQQSKSLLMANKQRPAAQPQQGALQHDKEHATVQGRHAPNVAHAAEQRVAGLCLCSSVLIFLISGTVKPRHSVHASCIYGMQHGMHVEHVCQQRLTQTRTCKKQSSLARTIVNHLSKPAL